jgi:hypothetical protein
VCITVYYIVLQCTTVYTVQCTTVYHSVTACRRHLMEFEKFYGACNLTGRTCDLLTVLISHRNILVFIRSRTVPTLVSLTHLAPPTASTRPSRSRDGRWRNAVDRDAFTLRYRYLLTQYLKVVHWYRTGTNVGTDSGTVPTVGTHSVTLQRLHCRAALPTPKHEQWCQ